MVLANWTIQRRVRLVTVCSLLLSLGALGAAGLATRALAGKLDEVVTTTDALRHQLHSDMMHDAIRGDVQGALIAAGHPNGADDWAAAARDLSEHSEMFSADIRALRALPLPFALHGSLAEVENEFREYIDAARAVVAASRQGSAATEAKMADFSRRFEALETRNGAVSEKIQVSAGQARVAAYSLVGQAGWTLLAFAGLLVLFGLGTMRFIGSMLGSLRDDVVGLAAGVQRVAGIAAEIGASSRDVVEAAAELAGSLDQTSQSSVRINDLAQGNSTLSLTVAESVHATQLRIEDANAQLDQMVESIRAIGQSSGEISKIIQIIDGIAFQTNLLALNAAVEAARAGSVGAGFAVVADEVRALASRCSDAARNTATLIEESIRRSQEGATKVNLVAASIRQVTDDSARVRAMVDKVSAASGSQSNGVAQVASLLSDMKTVNRRSASTMELTAKEAERLRSESELLDRAASRLLELSATY